MKLQPPNGWNTFDRSDELLEVLRIDYRLSAPKAAKQLCL
jgi:hypothetical protein